MSNNKGYLYLKAYKSKSCLCFYKPNTIVYFLFNGKLRKGRVEDIEIIVKEDKVIITYKIVRDFVIYYINSAFVNISMRKVQEEAFYEI